MQYTILPTAENNFRGNVLKFLRSVKFLTKTLQMLNVLKLNHNNIERTV